MIKNKPGQQIRICALIPFYNNRKTVDSVAAEVHKQIPDLILVNDGATDGSENTITPRPGQLTLTHACNKGKGAAVKTGAEYALKNGFTHVLQIDSDAQHNPAYIPEFIEKIHENPDCVIAGYREFGPHVPRASRFGRWFGNLWFKIETLGYPIKDTQCGFRAYPTRLFDNLPSRHNRMAFDVEILILALEKELHIIHLALEVRYFEGDERITFYRPFRDNLTMSSLHCIRTWMLLAKWPVFLKMRKEKKS